MPKKLYYLLITIFLFLTSCAENKKPDINEKGKNRIPVIRLDRESLSGIGLKPVKNNDQPDRRLFQKRLVRGQDLSVYVVSSETATAHQDNYGMEEFIKLINGRSRMHPVNGNELIFETGDSFIAPKGFTGEWETIGGNEFLIGLSVITTQRIEGQIEISKTLPFLIDKKIRSGVRLLNVKGEPNIEGTTEVYRGLELTIKMSETKPQRIDITKPMQEQVVEVISGKVSITPLGSETEVFLTGDYYMIPEGFIGTFEYAGHGNIRTVHIYKSILED
ncbi:MAG: putative cupin superfamily protein [Saprospiraceae bacterium]|jgi:uncharacterized cupin superfamily protein